jgi:DNA-binding MarR family transcriptional regulator
MASKKRAALGVSRGSARKHLRMPEDQFREFVARFPGFDLLRTDALFMLRTLAQRIDDDYNVLLAPFGLTAGRLSYLAVLAAVGPAGIPLGDLGARVRSSSANISVMVRSLERDGLVKRLRDPADARVRLLALTRKGEKLIERAFPVHLTNARAALKYVTQSDVERLVEILDKLGQGFDELMDRQSEH